MELLPLHHFPNQLHFGGAGIVQLYCYSSGLIQSLMILFQRSWAPQLQAHIVSDWTWIFAGDHLKLWLVMDLYRWSPQVVTGHGSLQVVTSSCDWSWIFTGDHLKLWLVMDLYRWSLRVVTGHGSLQVITLSCVWSWIFTGDHCNWSWIFTGDHWHCDWSWIFLDDNLKSWLVIDLYRWSLWMVMDVYRWSLLLLMVIDLYKWSLYFCNWS